MVTVLGLGTSPLAVDQKKQFIPDSLTEPSLNLIHDTEAKSTLLYR